jgi:hypothetical protein
VTAVFDIVVLGSGGIMVAPSLNCVPRLKPDYGATVVQFDGPVDFDNCPSRRCTSPTSFKSEAKTTMVKGASSLIVAEVNEVDSLCADADVDHFSAHPLDFADVMTAS